MSDNKKYYYLKLKDDFFETDEMIVLESMPDGYKYSNILLKMYLRSLKNEGKLMFNNTIPFNSQMLSSVTRHSVGDVEKAVQIFRELNLIEVLDNGAIFLTEIQNFIGRSSTEADRKREYRNRIELEKQLVLEEGQTSDKCPDNSPPELEIEIELETELERNKETSEKIIPCKYSDEHLRLANKLQDNLSVEFPKSMAKVKIESWAEHLRLMEEKDEVTIEQIEFIIDWLPTNEFWFGNIRSTAKLRKQYEKLKHVIKTERERPQPQYNFRKQVTRKETMPEWSSKQTTETPVSEEEQAEFERQLKELREGG